MNCDAVSHQKESHVRARRLATRHFDDDAQAVELTHLGNLHFRGRTDVSAASACNFCRPDTHKPFHSLAFALPNTRRKDSAIVTCMCYFPVIPHTPRRAREATFLDACQIHMYLSAACFGKRANRFDPILYRGSKPGI